MLDKLEKDTGYEGNTDIELVVDEAVVAANIFNGLISNDLFERHKLNLMNALLMYLNNSVVKNNDKPLRTFVDALKLDKNQWLLLKNITMQESHLTGWQFDALMILLDRKIGGFN